MRHGRDQRRGRYRKFLSQVEKAEAEAESRDVALIAKAASDDWRAAAWRLERKAPRRYGPRVRLAVQQELDAVLGRLEKDLPPEIYERVLQLIAAEDDEADAPAGRESGASAAMKWRLPEVARRRLWDRPTRFGAEDDRTPDERRRDNQELLRTVSAVLKQEVLRRVSELFIVDGRITADRNWIALLEAGLDRETFLDAIEAIVTLQHDA